MKKRKPRTWWKKLRAQNRNRCCYTPGCKRPTNGAFYCRRHRDVVSAFQKKRRGLHHQLGFCIYCLRAAVPGHSRCPKHLQEHVYASRRYRDEKKKERGWKMIRVKV